MPVPFFFDGGNRGLSLEQRVRRLFANGEAGAWYDPSDLSSLFQLSTGSTAVTVGDPVGYMADKSGRGNHATQATTTKRPILRQTAGGLLYLEFDGVDDYLAATFVSVAPPWTRVSALRQVAWTLNARIFMAPTNSGTIALYQNNVSPKLRINNGSGASIINSDAAIGADVVVADVFNGASSSLTVNNGTAATGDSGSNSSAGWAIGGASGEVSSQIYFYGGLLIARALSAGELISSKQWAGRKCGVAL